MSKIWFFSLWIILAAGCRGEKLTLPTVFSDHMVLQQNQPVPVWGTAAAGAEITVDFADQHKTVQSDENGKWRIDLDALTASSEPRSLTISAVKDSRVDRSSFSDVLVGEVWLCSGQSNMEMPIKAWEKPCVGADEAISSAGDYPLIRLYRVPKTLAALPSEHINASWEVSSSKSVPGFSGVAFFFGRKLQRDLNVPVGLIQSAWGGTTIEPWTPPAGFENTKGLRYLSRAAQPPLSFSGNDQQDKRLPSVLYNGMIHACIPYAVRGVIWYQGEANRKVGERYVDLSKALINGWRQLWGYEFPFYFVQIAPYEYPGEDPDILPTFWEAQSKIMEEIPNTYMAVISDAATPDNIHPVNKTIPGTRLALLAEDHTYGMEVISSGPVFRSVEKQDGGLKIIFDNADGLSTRDGKAPDWFEIAGADGVFKAAQAEIQADTVIAVASGVSDPKAVRYGWNKLAVPNLVNSAGLPAHSFRVDNL